MQPTEARNKIQLAIGQGQNCFNKKMTARRRNTNGKEKVSEKIAAKKENKIPSGKNMIGNDKRNNAFVKI